MIRTILKGVQWRLVVLRDLIVFCWTTPRGVWILIKFAATRIRKGAIVYFDAPWEGNLYFVLPLIQNLPSWFLRVIVMRAGEVERLNFLQETPMANGTGRTFVLSQTQAMRLWHRPAWICPNAIVSTQPDTTWHNGYTGFIPKIQMFHGSSDKRGELCGRNRLKNFSHVFSSGPLVTELVRERAIRASDCNKSLEIVPVGMPRTDQLLDNTFDRGQILKALKCDPNKPTVLYAPTWEKEASWEQYGLKIVGLLAQLDINLLVKLHYLSLGQIDDPWLVAHGHGGKAWTPILNEKIKGMPRVRNILDRNPYPYMFASDLMISDTSGIVKEYCILDRPLVIVDTPLVRNQYGESPLYEKVKKCCAVVEDIDQLCPVVLRHLKCPDILSSERRAMRQQLYYNPGTATQVAINALSALVDTK